MTPNPQEPIPGSKPGGNSASAAARPDARRPLKSRSTAWAHGCARVLLKAGVTPNAVSVASVGFAFVAAICFWKVGRDEAQLPGGWHLAWLGVILGIQGRLWCNLMDGMLAVEGGLKTPTGELYNEVPDRIADTLILAGAGWAASVWHPWGWHLAWASATVACITAYVRVLGATLTGRHDFRGPMAKPHRMAVLTVASLAAAVEQGLGRHPHVLTIALVVVVLLGVVTCVRRLQAIAAQLNGRAS